MMGRSRGLGQARFGCGRDSKTSEIPFILNVSTDQLEKKKKCPAQAVLLTRAFPAPALGAGHPPQPPVQDLVLAEERPWQKALEALWLRAALAAALHREGSHSPGVCRFCSSHPGAPGTSLPLPVAHRDRTPGSFNYLFFLSAFCLFSPSFPFFFVFLSLFSDSF